MRVDLFTTPWPPVDQMAVAAFRDAVDAAAGADRDLLVLVGEVRATPEAVGVLQAALASDPMFGFAIARVTGGSDRTVARLDAAGDPAVDELPRRVLAEMPETYVTADVPAHCTLVRASVLSEIGEVDERFRSVPGALWRLMTRARRCGFRAVVCNRAVIASAAARRPYSPSTFSIRSLPDADRILLRELAPDLERSVRDFGPSSVAAAETRLARTLHAAYGTRPSLLIDARNMGAAMNGTTVAILGICGGLHALRPGWDLTLLAPEEAAACHELDEKFPGWQIATTLPRRQFTAALRLSQPWHMQELIDLHCLAAFNAYLFLDTIAWDVAYPAPRHLDGTWQFMADQADALLFNSAYTRDRFRRRFPIPADRPELVAYHSFDPAEYAREDVRLPEQQEDFIFVVGNEYDHKDVAATTQLLATAFPYQSIVALGGASAPTPRVQLLESGAVPDAAMHRLYAGARVVVFPSFYEGFGFPVLSTLAYGGTVVVRRSALMEEIAARCVPRGRVVPFDRRRDLVEIVGRILHGEPVETVPLGTALSGPPLSWRGVASRIIDFLAGVTANLSQSRWRQREQVINQLLAAPTALTEKAVRRPAHAGAA